MVRRIVWMILWALAAPALSLADEREDARAIETAAQAWIAALNARDVEGMLHLASDDVVLMDAAQPSTVGKEAARVAWRRSLPESGTQVTTVTKELEVDADIAWRIAALVHERTSGQIVSRGQSLEIWKRIEGEWKLHRQMSSSLLARQPLLRRPLPTEPVLDAPRETN